MKNLFVALLIFTVGMASWRCEPHAACREDLAEMRAAAAKNAGLVSECRRWTP